ncbi:hypothetical protein A2U01_0101308, partial [Trifolium medium]|nr:hypothetical protein [Trifolium medium]
ALGDFPPHPGIGVAVVEEE